MKLQTKSMLYTIRDVINQIIDDPDSLDTYCYNFGQIEEALRYKAVEETDPEKYAFLHSQCNKYRALRYLCMSIQDTEEFLDD